MLYHNIQKRTTRNTRMRSSFAKRPSGHLTNCFHLTLPAKLPVPTRSSFPPWTPSGRSTPNYWRWKRRHTRNTIGRKMSTGSCWLIRQIWLVCSALKMSEARLSTNTSRKKNKRRQVRRRRWNLRSLGFGDCPQQAETESSASGRNLFVLSLSDQEGIACRNVHPRNMAWKNGGTRFSYASSVLRALFSPSAVASIMVSSFSSISLSKWSICFRQSLWPFCLSG